MTTQKKLLIAALGTLALFACKARQDGSALREGGATGGGGAGAFLAGCGKADQVSADRPIDTALYAQRVFVSDEDLEDCIYADLQSITDDSLVPNVRYLTLTHFYNAGASQEELLFYRGAISKAINSLTYAPRIARPQLVDPLGTIVRINLVDYEWDKELPGFNKNRWDMVFNTEAITFQNEEDFTAERGPNFSVHPAYPYMRQLPKYHENERTGRLARNSLRYVYGRGDWFVARATIPPLYHAILQMGADDLSLEEQVLGARTRVEENIQVGRVIRAGFDSSSVSSNNRMLERHEGRFRDSYYWKSYDFANSVATSNFKANPFGPCFRTIAQPQPFARQLSQAALFKPCSEVGSDDDFQKLKVFKQGGGEIIYSLPNGMQAYFLIKGDGKRLSAGPANIVADLSNPTDKFIVINGRSCMFCHNQGMIDGKEDEVGPAVRKLLEGTVYWDARVNKKELELFVEKVHPLETVQGGQKRNKIKRSYDQDRSTFMRAEREVVGPDLYLTTDPPARQEPFKALLARKRYNEVINFLNDRYQETVTRDQAAAELGLTTADMLKRIGDGGIADQEAMQFLRKFTRDAGVNTMTRQQFESLFPKLAAAVGSVPSTLGQTATGDDALELTCDNNSVPSNTSKETAYLIKKPDGKYIGAPDGYGQSASQQDCEQLLNPGNRKNGLICAPYTTNGYGIYRVADGKRPEGDTLTFRGSDKNSCMTAVQNSSQTMVCTNIVNSYSVVKIADGAVVQDYGTDFRACITRARAGQ